MAMTMAVRPMALPRLGSVVVPLCLGDGIGILRFVALAGVGFRPGFGLGGVVGGSGLFLEGFEV